MSTPFTRPLWTDYSAIEADLPALLEIARLALHHDTCEFFILENQTGLNQDELMRLRSRLDQFVSAEPPAGSTGSPLARALTFVPNYIEPPQSSIEVALHILFGLGGQKRSLRQLATARAYASAYYSGHRTGSPTDRTSHANQAVQALYEPG